MKQFYYFAENHNESKIVKAADCNEVKKHIQWTSCSARYNTLKELKADLGILKLPCLKCSRTVSTHYMEPVKKQLIEQNVCFHCNFWMEKLLIKNNSNVARIGGKHYIISPDIPNAAFKGFGGREFKIQFNDGRTVVTHNLWHQGEIPEHFKKDLPDNAKFI